MRSLPGGTLVPEGLPFCNVCEYIYNFRFIAAIRFQPPKPTKKTSKHRARALSLTLNLCGVQTRATRRPNPSPTPAAAQFAMIPYRVHVGSRNS